MDLRIFLKEVHDERKQEWDSLPEEVKANLRKSPMQRNFEQMEEKWKRIRQQI
jgi:hypothetical protein